MEPTQDLNHPDDRELAAFGEAALGPVALERLAMHLDSCRSCKERLERLQPELSEYSQCLEAVHARVSRPQQRDEDLRSLFQERLERPEPTRKTAPVRRWQVAWVGGVAASIAVWVSLVSWSGHAQELRAETLLAQASAVPGANLSHRTLRVRTQAASFLRSQANVRAEATLISARFVEANYDWNDPLSAQSYSAWRHSLKHKTSKVTTPVARRDEQQIETTTQDGTLRMASLTLDAKLSPVSGLFQFSDREWVEITSVPDPGTNSVTGLVPTPGSAPPTSGTSENVPREPLAERELSVRLAINVLHTGASEPIQVSTGSGDILVTAYHLTADQEKSLEQSLKQISGVTLQTLNQATPQSQADAPFTDETGRILQIGQDCSFEAHLLAELAERFQPAAEATLSASSKSRLWDLRTGHISEMNRHMRELEQNLQQASPDFHPDQAGSSRSTAQDVSQNLARSAEALDRLLVTLFASGDSKSQQGALWPQISTEFSRLQSLTLEYARSLGQIKVDQQNPVRR